jgi:hypothetical protein
VCEVELIFTGKTGGRGRPHKQPPGHQFKTKIVTSGVDVTVNVFWKHSRIKQYLKDGRAWRIETVVNSPDDVGVQRRLTNLAQLQVKARAANRRILDVQRAGQGCAIGADLFGRLQQPYAREGRRTGALRFGDPRAMALAGALCLTLHAVTGFNNRSLRAQVAGLLDNPYSVNQMSYDLGRLRCHGLIRRLHRQHRYVLTDEGRRFAVFYTKLGNRVVAPLFAADQPNAPMPLRRALATIDRATGDYLSEAGLMAA